MEAITVRDLLTAVGGTLIGPETSLDRTVSSVDTDSRDIHPGSLFLPLVGERFDGHTYIGSALEAGAAGCLTAREPEHYQEGRFYIKVEDTQRALRDLAFWYKEQFRIPFVGVTGSVGKTTAKDMIASVLSAKYKVLKTEGNFNNNVGLPLTLILIFSVLLTNKFILRVDFSCLANAPLVDANEAKLNQDQKTAVKFVIALCVAMIIPGFVSKSFPVFGVLGSTGCAFLVLAIMLVVRRNGQPLVKMKDIAKHVNWDVLLLLAAMFPMVNALGDEEVGITALIESTLGGLTGLSPFLFLFILVIATGILTQFMNNAIASSLVVTGLCMMGSVLPKGVSLEGLTLLIAFSTNLACWLPSATAANAYGYGQTDVVEFKHYFRSGLIHLIVMLILVGVVGVGLVSVVYRGML